MFRSRSVFGTGGRSHSAFGRPFVMTMIAFCSEILQYPFVSTHFLTASHSTGVSLITFSSSFAFG